MWTGARAQSMASPGFACCLWLIVCSMHPGSLAQVSWFGWQIIWSPIFSPNNLLTAMLAPGNPFSTQQLACKCSYKALTIWPLPNSTVFCPFISVFISLKPYWASFYMLYAQSPLPPKGLWLSLEHTSLEIPVWLEIEFDSFQPTLHKVSPW